MQFIFVIVFYLIVGMLISAIEIKEDNPKHKKLFFITMSIFWIIICTYRIFKEIITTLKN